MDKNTLNYFGEVIASLSAWYSYECARLDEKPRDIDGNQRGKDDHEIERFISDCTGAKEQDMITYADGSFRVRNDKTGLLEYRFVNFDNSISSVYGYSRQECWIKRANAPKKRVKREKKQTFAEWAETWFNTYKKPFNGEQSLKSIRLYIDTLNKIFKGKALCDITILDCQNAVNKFAEKPNTQKKLYQVLRGIMQKAHLQGLINKSPAEDIMLTPHIAEHYRALTYEEQNLVYFSSDEKHRQLFFFCCCTGIRFGRVLTLTRENIENGYINVTKKQKKGLKQVYNVPFLPELLDGLPENGRLFPLSASRVRKYFKEICEKHGIKGATIHSFRHTFISVLYDLGLDPKRIQTYAGHADIQLTLNTYTHLLSGGTSPIKDYLARLIKS